MTDALLQFAEEEFMKNDFEKAYGLAKLATKLDPFYGDGCLDKYVAAYRVHHAAAKSKKETGLTDWYEVLGIPYTSPEDAVIHRFRKMGKLIDPDDHPSVAAKGAYFLLGRAVEVLAQPETRVAYDSHWERLVLPKLLPAKSLCSAQSLTQKSCRGDCGFAMPNMLA